MNKQLQGAEAVVRKHLDTFLQGQGADAIVSDYDEGARLYTEGRVFVGQSEIRRFFSQFLDALPPGTTKLFQLRSLQSDYKIAFITWSVAGYIPLGTDTFVVEDGKIISQTFAMHAMPGPAGLQG
jgi:hypothetical protein